MVDYQFDLMILPSVLILARYFFIVMTNTMNMKNTGKIIIGFLVGSMIGIVTGLLVAPTSGKQARKKIGKKSKRIAKQVAGYIGREEKPQSVGSKRKNGKEPVEA